jgi:thioredoxin-like negative regulator of GroEL
MTTKERNTKILIGSAIGIIAAIMYGHKFKDPAAAAANFADVSVIGRGKPVLLQFGSQSYALSREMILILAELDKKYPRQFTVAYSDVQKDFSVAEKYAISAIPLQIFFDKDGQELFRHEGFFPKADILAKWKELGVELPK